MNALHRCFKRGESIKSVSEEIGYTRVGIYAWRKKYLRGCTVSLINDKNIQPDTLMEGNAITPATENEQPQEQMQNIQLEIDLLKENNQYIKKRPRYRSDSLEKP